MFLIKCKIVFDWFTAHAQFNSGSHDLRWVDDCKSDACGSLQEFIWLQYPEFKIEQQSALVDDEHWSVSLTEPVERSVF